MEKKTGGWKDQYKYSDAHNGQAKDDNFACIDELMSKYPDLYKENLNNRTMQGKDAVHANCLMVLMDMGIRPGAVKETGAVKKAYGGVTLLAKHVVDREDGVHLEFTGKKGVEQNHMVENPKIAAMLKSRASQVSENDRLFQGINEFSLLKYTGKLDGKGFTPKNFRTRVGTVTAMEEIKSMRTPSSMKEYKQQVMSVARTVSEKLGNRPAEALKSYINPAVWSVWRVGVEKKGSKKFFDDYREK